MNTADPTYQDGLRDGRLRALEEIAHRHHDRLDDHSARIRILERIAWILAGIIGFIQLWPTIERMLT